MKVTNGTMITMECKNCGYRFNATRSVMRTLRATCRICKGHRFKKVE